MPLVTNSPTREIHLIVDGPDTVLEMPIFDEWDIALKLVEKVGNHLIDGIYTATLEWYEPDTSDVSAKDVKVTVTDSKATITDICCKLCVRV